VTAANLNAFSTRVYNYNAQLKQNSTIPFLPSIANIVSWEEINPPVAR
jgi:hypothetical protein